VNLNALPRLDSVLLYSIVKNKNSGRAEYQLVVATDISDDKDIDSVFLTNNELQIRQPLLKKSSTHFAGTFSDFDLNLSSFEIIIGRTFSILAREISGNYVNIGGATVKRIINQEIEILSPINSDIVSTVPTLRWKRFTPGFEFSYTLEIYTDDIEPILKWSTTNISKDSIYFSVDSPLDTSTTNEFFWVIWGIDEFNNKTRSKPASFIVQ